MSPNSKLHLLLVLAAVSLFNLPSFAQQSRIENGLLIVPRIDVDETQSFTLSFRIDSIGDILFILENASAAEPDSTRSGIYDPLSQTISLDEIALESGELYSATLTLMSQSPAVIFGLSGAELLYAPPGNSQGSDSTIDIQSTMALPQLNCTNSACHDSTPGTSRLNLLTGSLGDLALRLVDQPSGSPACSDEKLVDSTNPSNSLLLKLIDPNSGEQCIAKMPFGQSGVADEYYAEFEDWVYQLIGASESSGTDSDQDSLKQALDGFSALKRTKYILHGGALTDEDYLTALDDEGNLDNEGLKSVISTWFDTEPFKRKMLSFLAVAFHQNEFGPITPNYFEMLGVTWGLDMCTKRPVGLYTHDAMELTLNEIVPRTAYRLIENNGDFRDITTTKEFVVNSIGLFAFALGEQETDGTRDDDGHNLCQFPGLSLGDFHDWRTVTLTPSPVVAHFEGNSPEFVQSIRSIPDGGSFALKANRGGICNSFSFLANWPTNVSNQFRLNVSQCMIAALGLIFEAGDDTPPNSLAGLDSSHIDPSTECYGCHQHLDPMTNVFRGQYDLSHRLLQTVLNDNDGDFSFQGYSQTVSTMDDFNSALSAHPHFAMGIALKLCQWATSQVCSKDDPDMQTVTNDFINSGYQFKELILSLFTSPLLTTVNQSGSFSDIGSKISATRGQHMCLSLETRMEQQLATDREDSSDPDPKVCLATYDGMKASESMPNDLFQRGYGEFIQASNINLLTPKLNEPLCDAFMDPMIQAFEGNLENRKEQTLEGFTKFLIGIPPAANGYNSVLDTLDIMYDVGRAPQCGSDAALTESLNGNQSCGFGMNHTDSMRFVFRNVCLAPSTTAIGL